MKTEWKKYLESIGMNENFQTRVQEILDFYQQIGFDDIRDIFVNEYIDSEGNRQYEALYLFSSTQVMEAKQFLTEDDFDAAPLKLNIRYWSIKKTEYDFSEVSSKSRLLVNFILSAGSTCSLKASQDNCEKLKLIFLKFIFPNVNFPSASTE